MGTLVHANSTKALQVVRDGKVKAWFAAQALRISTGTAAVAAEKVLATKLTGRNAATTALNNANNVDSKANAKSAVALAAFDDAKKAQAAAATAQANLVGGANLASATSSGVNKAALRATATNVSNSATSAHEAAEKAALLASQGASKSKAAAMKAHKSYDEFVKEGHAYGYVH